MKSTHLDRPLLYRLHLPALYLAPWLAVLPFSGAGHSMAPAAQMDMSGHVMETRDETAPEQLPKPRKMSGVGNVRLQVTATAEAQMWFNQGLNLLHDFWDYESARAFEQSVRVDPQCAMCYWGLYKAQSFYHSMAQDYAGQSLATAIDLKDHASKRERFYIEASAAHEDELKHSGGKPSFSRELQLWRDLVREYPTDTQGQIFLSGMTGREERLSILESILKQEPENSAANHYYIHALEGGDHPERALGSAEILAKLAPASGHMVHMPGHIFFRMGNYARAEQAFAASMRVDDRYMRKQHVQPDDDWNFVHNLMYAIANLMEEGKMTEATALSMKTTSARGELDSTLYTYSVRDSTARLDPRLPVALRTANWEQVAELLKSSAPHTERPNLTFLAHQLAEFASGMLAIERHDLSRAEESRDRFDAELLRMSQNSKKALPVRNNPAPGSRPQLQVMPDALLAPLLKSLSIMSLELKASLLAARGKTDEAKSLFAEAAKAEKELGYREPPSYIRPVGETEGAAMANARHWSEARAAYGRALLERPRSGLSLYGIALSSEEEGKTETAVKDYEDFLVAWKNADRALAQVNHARGFLAAHEGKASAVFWLPEIGSF